MASLYDEYMDLLKQCPLDQYTPEHYTSSYNQQREELKLDYQTQSEITNHAVAEEGATAMDTIEWTRYYRYWLVVQQRLGPTHVLGGQVSKFIHILMLARGNFKMIQEADKVLGSSRGTSQSEEMQKARLLKTQFSTAYINAMKSLHEEVPIVTKALQDALPEHPNLDTQAWRLSEASIDHESREEIPDDVTEIDSDGSVRSSRSVSPTELSPSFSSRQLSSISERTEPGAPTS